MSIKKLTAICAVLLSVVPVYAQTNWSNPEAIANTGMNPRIARDSAGGLAVCGYSTTSVTSGTIVTERHMDIYATFSTDAGNSWSNPIRLSDPKFYNYEPAVTAAAPGEFQFCWTSGDALSGFRFHTARTTDGGITFTTATRLQNLTDTAQAFLSNDIEEVAGKTIVLRTGFDYAPPIRENLTYLDSQTGIASPWSTTQAPSPPTTTTVTGGWAGGLDSNDAVVIATSTLFVDSFTFPYDDNVLLVTRSTDSGQTWQSTILPTQADYAIRSSTIQHNGAGTWMIMWNDVFETNPAGRLFAARSTDNGQTWSAPIQVATGYALTPNGSAGALAGDAAGRWIFLNASGRYTYSSDNGATWSSLGSLPATPAFLGRDLVYNGNGQWVAVMADVTGIKKSTLQWGESAVGNWELY